MHVKQKQSGFALLLFMIVAIGLVIAGFSELLIPTFKQQNTQHRLKNMEVLLEAKQALLSFAVDYTIEGEMDKMGYLPCPDVRVTGGPPPPPPEPPEGMQDEDCGAQHANSSGLFPWKTIGTAPLRDSDGECLWYVVSGDYKTSPESYMLNADTNGLLEVEDESGKSYHGAAAGDRPVALIIAPGKALQGQTRGKTGAQTHCIGGYDEAHYLEPGESVNYATDHVNYATDHDNTADDIWTYVFGSAAAQVDNITTNDQMVWVTRDELWSAVKKQKDLDITVSPNSAIHELTKKLAECLGDNLEDSDNVNKWLPWPAPIDLTEYREDATNFVGSHEYKDVLNPAPLMGRFPQDITISEDNILAQSGSDTDLHGNRDNIIDACLNDEEEKLWQNWKDHFFLVVSRDFETLDGPSSVPMASRCATVGRCVTIHGSLDKIAAIVFYADSPTLDQSRNASPVDADEKGDLTNYLETVDPDKSNAHQYPSDGTYASNGGDVFKYYRGIGDLTYCLVVNGTNIDVTDCS